jgi:hypothetical protein
MQALADGGEKPFAKKDKKSDFEY